MSSGSYRIENPNRIEIEAIAGLSAGCATTLVTHPLDLIKVRLQLSKYDPKSNKSPLKRVLKGIDESSAIEMKKYKGNNALKHAKFPHLIHQFYRGLAPNLIGNVTAWSLYLTLYLEFKSLANRSEKGKDSTFTYFSASSAAGLTCYLITNPIWVLKTRILATSKYERGAYSSVLDGVKQIMRNEGVLGFWKGAVPGMVLVLQASLQITIYDRLNGLLLRRRSQENILSTVEYIFTSGLSKIASSLVMYPAQVVKTRLQSYNLNNEKRTVWLTSRSIWRYEGKWRGFYKGFGANLLRVVPATCVTFVTYESVKKYLST